MSSRRSVSRLGYCSPLLGSYADTLFLISYFLSHCCQLSIQVEAMTPFGMH